jgi:hypothetical protein
VLLNVDAFSCICWTCIMSLKTSTKSKLIAFKMPWILKQSLQYPKHISKYKHLRLDLDFAIIKVHHLESWNHFLFKEEDILDGNAWYTSLNIELVISNKIDEQRFHQLSNPYPKRSYIKHVWQKTLSRDSNKQDLRFKIKLNNIISININSTNSKF